MHGEFLAIEYAKGDKLYVPVAQLHLISRYSGASPEIAPLHSLGGEAWEKAKRKAAEKVRDVAAELLEIQARRAARAGPGAGGRSRHVRTVRRHLPVRGNPRPAQPPSKPSSPTWPSPQPMDRVVCGDVGFGKTEVAVRAAFVAATAGKQVAVLVPTTLLAEQHYRNFRDRFADWPIRVEVLSRFKSAKEIKAALGAAGRRQDRRHRRHPPPAAGRREVQGPGPGHRRRGTALRRAPEGSAEGAARRSAPADADRHADPAHAEHGDERTARPLDHRHAAGAPPGGARPSSRPGTTRCCAKPSSANWRAAARSTSCTTKSRPSRRWRANWQELVPEARIRIAHGQMPERELEQVMLDFHRQRFNVLVCTTIIESGIDIPSANTIIINRADKFGLAQLHQLRGRVGRSHHRAYAYLVVPDKQGDHRRCAKSAWKRWPRWRNSAPASPWPRTTWKSAAPANCSARSSAARSPEIGFSLYTELLERAVRVDQLGQDARPRRRACATAPKSNCTCRR